MNQEEYLLTCLAEECAEVIQAVAKIQRFGPKEKNPALPTSPNNREQLLLELNDIFAVADLLRDMSALPFDWYSVDRIEEKRSKLTRYMVISRSLGTLK